MSNKDIFLSKAIAKHSNRYSYSKVVYTNCKQKVVITCPVHGDFEQTPDSHISGSGCLACGGRKQLNTAEFIIRANTKHNFKYTYNKAVYTNARTKVVITCPEHGDFEQTPDSHLRGNGCPKCSALVTANKLMDTQEQFLTKAIAKHGNTYSYTKAVYTGNKNKVIITCQIHGDFKQDAGSHLAGHGCDKCAQHEARRKYHDVPTTVYFIKLDTFSNLYKIGITIFDVSKRFRQDIKEGVNLEVIQTKHFSTGEDAYLLEQKLLNKYKEFQYLGTNVLRGGNSELLVLSDDQVKQITLELY